MNYLNISGIPFRQVGQLDMKKMTARCHTGVGSCSLLKHLNFIINQMEIDSLIQYRKFNQVLFQFTQLGVIDISVKPTTLKSIRLNSRPILWHAGMVRDIFMRARALLLESWCATIWNSMTETRLAGAGNHRCHRRRRTNTNCPRKRGTNDRQFDGKPKAPLIIPPVGCIKCVRFANKKAGYGDDCWT